MNPKFTTFGETIILWHCQFNRAKRPHNEELALHLVGDRGHISGRSYLSQTNKVARGVGVGRGHFYQTWRVITELNLYRGLFGAPASGSI